MKKILIVLALVASAGCARTGGDFGLMNFDIENPAHLVAAKTAQNYKPQAEPPKTALVKPKANGTFRSHFKQQVKPRVTPQVKTLPVVDLQKTRDYNPLPEGYKFHTQTKFVKLHWNLSIKDNQAVADGFLQSFNQDVSIHAVELELDGLDSGGNLINSAPAVIKQTYIAYPRDKAHFRVIMVLRGGEKEFRVKGSYHHCAASDFSNDSLDHIPY